MNTLIKSKNKFVYQLSKPTYNATRLVDGKEQTPSIRTDWFESDNEPKQYTDTVTRTKQSGWKLKPAFIGGNLVDNLPSDAFEVDEDGEYPEESIAYDRVYDTETEATTTDIVWDKVFDEEIIESVTFTGTKRDMWKDVTVQINPIPSYVHEKLYPDIVLPNKQCALSSQQMFTIIRHHISTNIDPKYAEVTSNYDFCFEVKKKLAIEPEKRSYDANFFSRSKRVKMVNYIVTDRKVSVFEMTHKESNYKNYTPIAGIVATSHRELQNKVDNVLSVLMDIINAPLISCDHCSGTGVLQPVKVAHKELNI